MVNKEGAPPPPEGIKFSLFTSDADALAKSFRLNPDNVMVKDTFAFLNSGRVETLTVETLDEFAALLPTLNSKQALAYGVSKRGDGLILSEGRWEKAGKPAGVLLRNRDHFEYSIHAGIWMLDYDPPKNGPVLQREELLQRLYAAMPELENAAQLWMPSSGSCVYRGGEEIIGVRGQRVYVAVTEARAIPALGEILTKRLWIAGEGRIEISKSGRRNLRTIVDALVFQPERLDFAAGAVCKPPLEQRRGAPLHLGGLLPLNAYTVKAITESESERYDRAVEVAKAAVEAEVQQVRASFVSTRAQEMQAAGVSEETASRVANRAMDGQLLGDFILVSAEGERVSVAELLGNKQLWHGHRFHDPLEPDYPDKRIAWANLFSGGQPYLWSHAHGARRYTLSRAQRIVQITEGGTGEAVEQTLDAMRGDDFYEYGESVIVISDSGKVRTLGPYALKQEIERVVQFQKYDGRKKGCKLSDCPDEIARRIREMSGRRNLRTVSRVIHYPTMASDGRIIDKPGYDAATRLLLLNPGGQLWPTVPAAPTEREVLEALARFWSPFALFPFKDDTSRAVALAALLTACVRPTLSVAPAFLFAAPTSGSGKTLLASCAVELAGGASATTLPNNNVETHKTIVSSLRAAPVVLFFDNVTGNVGCEALNILITSPTYSGRILGLSENTPELPTNVLIVMTGNNARPHSDMCRRMLVSTIDPQMEAPYRRSFTFNPLEHVRREMLAMRGDALAILAGRFAAGKTTFTSEPPLGGFEEWEHAVRQTVVWIGQLERAALGGGAVGFGDPVAGVQEQYAEDEETEALGNVLEVMAQAQDGTGFKSGELYSALDRTRRDSVTGTGAIDVLGQMLFNAAPWAKNPLSLSRWFKSVRGRIVRGLRLETDLDRSANSLRWFVQRVAV